MMSCNVSYRGSIITKSIFEETIISYGFSKSIVSFADGHGWTTGHGKEP